MALAWYVLHSKPSKEAVVLQQALIQGIEVFFPHVPANPTSRRSRKVKPYFPGYLFVHVDLDVVGVSTFQWMPHAIGLIAFDGIPCPVPETLVATIQKQVAVVRATGNEWHHRLKPGDHVKIQEGPFAGYEAIFDMRLSGSDRVRVLLKMLNDRHITMALRTHQLAPSA